MNAGSESSPYRFSAVIPVKNQPELLARLLASLDEHASRTLLTEVIVVDDGSDVDLRSVARRHDRVRYHRVEVSGGPAAARNAGADLAVEPWLFFFDADVVCPPGLFEKAAEVLAAHPDCAALSFVNQAYDAAANDIANYHSVIERHWFEAMLGEGQDVARIRGVTSRGATVRKAAFAAVHGFDTRYRTNAHEDYDFGKRLSAQFPVLMTRTPCMYHSYPVSLRRLLRNYWVRTSLFVPYSLTHRPRLEEVQSSPAEAMLRILGVASGALAGGSLLLPPPVRWVAIGLAGAGLAGYAWAVSGLLRRAWRESRRASFVARFFAVHYISSVVIVLAAGIATVRWLVAGPSQELLSPIETRDGRKTRAKAPQARD